MGGPTTGVALGADGVHVPTSDDERVLDLLVDERRVWSFRPSDQAVSAAGSAGALVAWPRDLRGYLDGTARFAVRDQEGQVLAEAELSLGDDPTRRIVVADADGHPLVVDTGGRLVRTFESRGADALVPLMDALEVVLAALHRCGVEAFPAYGTLLGAVRDGHVIGHDNDADVGYVSRCTHPADVVLESFRLQRALQAEGFTISRYSGGAIKIEVDAGSGVHIGLDVFAGYFPSFLPGHLCLMGEILEPFDPAWIFPLGEVELEGRRLPAPAEPERLLAATYGEGWRVPDPAFVYRTPESTRRRLDGWFRGTRTYRNLWDRRYSTSAMHGPWNRDPHKLARFLNRREQPGPFIADIACGRGQDAVWLANRGHRVVGLDYSGNGYHHLAQRAEAEGWTASFAPMNLLESRHVVAWAARLGLEDGPRALLARHVLDATSPRGRAGLWRLAASVLGPASGSAGGGRLYLEFMAADPAGEGRPDIVYDDGLVHDVRVDVVRAEAEAAGGQVTVSRLIEARGYERPSQPVAGSPEPRKCRMVVEWAP